MDYIAVNCGIVYRATSSSARRRNGMCCLDAGNSARTFRQSACLLWTNCTWLAERKGWVQYECAFSVAAIPPNVSNVTELDRNTFLLLLLKFTW